MTGYTCPYCGAKLKIDRARQKAYCEYCHSDFALQDDTVTPFDREKEEKDRENRLAELAAKRRARLEKLTEEERARRKKWLWISIIAALIIGGTVWITAGKMIRAARHDHDKIGITVQSMTSEEDSNHSYIYFDFEIRNDSKATVDYIKVSTRMKDLNGKSFGTVTSEFGSLSGGSVLSLKPGRSTIEEVYLSENTKLMTQFFQRIYGKTPEDLLIEQEILYVRWSDGFVYKR
ncbi:MAG: hypothetical protein J5493_06675 [Lachnospiraceae bacterium]|nr:hypothetical protein [Lachnospiraceae bacterium]